jgi:hypothetical protein
LISPEAASVVVDFEQTCSPDVLQTLAAPGIAEIVMAIAKISKHKEYPRYEAHCLNIVPNIKNQDDRIINREMAAEWLRLAEAVLHPISEAARIRRPLSFSKRAFSHGSLILLGWLRLQPAHS